MMLPLIIGRECYLSRGDQSFEDVGGLTCTVDGTVLFEQDVLDGGIIGKDYESGRINLGPPYSSRFEETQA